jgi:ABC-type transport system involved in multi-copper enzyme maturation permease subunit
MNTLLHPALPATPPEACRFSAARAQWDILCAVAGVVLKEFTRRKDFYVLFVLTALITALMGSVSLFSQDQVVRGLKEICLFLIWASTVVITITAAARQIPSEREQRTLFPLLAKPVTRTQLVLGKFLGCWLAVGLALVLFYLFFALIAGAREHHWPLFLYFQALTLHWFGLGVVCAMTLLGSIVFAAPSSNTTILLVVTTGLLLVARHLNKVALRLEQPAQTILYCVYYAVPQLQNFDVRELIIHDQGLIPWVFWAGALLYAAVYAAFFLTATCLLFRRKPIV